MARRKRLVSQQKEAAQLMCQQLIKDLEQAALRRDGTTMAHVVKGDICYMDWTRPGDTQPFRRVYWCGHRSTAYRCTTKFEDFHPTTSYDEVKRHVQWVHGHKVSVSIPPSLTRYTRTVELNTDFSILQAVVVDAMKQGAPPCIQLAPDKPPKVEAPPIESARVMFKFRVCKCSFHRRVQGALNKVVPAVQRQHARFCHKVRNAIKKGVDSSSTADQVLNCSKVEFKLQP